MKKWFLRHRQSFSPTAVIAIGFAILILIGAFLLSLPVAAIDHKSIGGFDALFTATSAVCVTGLIVRDTATTFSVFGKVVLICLIQVGGLGFMAFATLMLRMLGERLTLRQRMIAGELMNEEHLGGIGNLITWVVVSTFTVELAGAVLLSFRMIPTYGFVKGAAYSVFHAISAFCNAGFDLFGNFASLTGFTTDVLINLSVAALVIIGGLGFTVLQDLCTERRPMKWRMHTKVVLTAYGVLLGFGFLFNLLVEWNNPATLGNLSFWQKLMAAFFQSVTLRTAGFNTIDQLGMRQATKLINCILMFVGASPASTGGGVKVTTFAMLYLIVRMVVKGEDEINVFHRRLERTIVQRAVAVLTLALSIVLIDVIALSIFEPNADFLDVLYECASAMGTVGISALGTPSLTRGSQTFIMFTMYLGRIGPMTAALILASRQKKNNGIRYPEDRLMIG